MYFDEDVEEEATSAVVEDAKTVSLSKTINSTFDRYGAVV
mgnify:CR=1 FL=1